MLIEHLIGIPEGNAVVPGAFEPLDRVYFTGDFIYLIFVSLLLSRWGRTYHSKI